MAEILVSDTIGIHPTVAPAEFRQVCDFLNRLVKAYGANFDALNTSLTSLLSLEADLQEGIVFADDGSATYAVTTRSGDYVSYRKVVGTMAYITNVSATYTVIPSDKIILATGTFTITMPTAVGNDGRVIVVKNISTGTVKVDGSGSETIDSGADIDLIQDETIILVSDGKAWRII